MKFIMATILMISGGWAYADEGGVSFWVPGQVGSFAATLTDSGWSLPMTYYFSSADANRSQSFTYDTQVTAGLDSKANLIFFSPTYTFKESFWKGQASLGAAVAVGQNEVSGEANLSFPGNSLTAKRSDLSSGFTDVFVTGAVKWNHGVHNSMTYASFNIPVGDYKSDRLANLGIGHWSFDVGGAYTYFNEKRGLEFSSTLGITYNLENTNTKYKNGVDVHLDVAGAQFFTEKFLAGVAGYYYDQLTEDSGSGALIDGFKSRVAGLGPQVGYFFDAGDEVWYGNLKAYWEFDAKDRSDGWNAWLTFSIPL